MIHLKPHPYVLIRAVVLHHKECALIWILPPFFSLRHALLEGGCVCAFQGRRFRGGGDVYIYIHPARVPLSPHRCFPWVCSEVELREQIAARGLEVVGPGLLSLRRLTGKMEPPRFCCVSPQRMDFLKMGLLVLYP